jgi:hypothetical protein
MAPCASASHAPAPATSSSSASSVRWVGGNSLACGNGNRGGAGRAEAPRRALEPAEPLETLLNDNNNRVVGKYLDCCFVAQLQRAGLKWRLRRLPPAAAPPRVACNASRPAQAAGAKMQCLTPHASGRRQNVMPHNPRKRQAQPALACSGTAPMIAA